MTRVSSLWTGVIVLLGILAILTPRPVIVHAEQGEYEYFDFCSCYIWSP